MTPRATPPPIALEVQLESTAEQVAGALRAAIVDGRLEQGDYLRETPLSDRFGVSRNTIRAATQILEGEGLVTRVMHRGAFVARLDEDDVRDLYRVRRVVELRAVQEAAAADRSRLRLVVAELAAAIEADDPVGIVSADLRFHRGLVALMGSDRLGGLFDSAEGELRLCMARGGVPHPDPGDFLAEHVAVLDALDAGDAAGAGRLLAEHLDRAERSLLDRLASHPA